MKIIFMGTPDMAVPCLKAIYDAGYDIGLVVTQSDKPKGRGNVMQSPPVKVFAESLGLMVYQPERIKNNEEIIDLFKEIAPDFIVVVAYGKILPKEILEIPKIAPVNVHFSLLPKYRGAAPVNWAILNGDEETGVSTMLMDIGMDTGDILLKKETPIERKTAYELSSELAISSAELLIKTLKNFDIITPLKQDETQVSIAPMMKKEMGLIDWKKSATDIERMVRGFYPWPNAYTIIDGKILKIYSADVVPLKIHALAGVVEEVSVDSFVIACGELGLQVNEVQLEGKKRMNVKDFFNGYNVSVGLEFGK